jgi:putative phosphoesterase
MMKIGVLSDTHGKMHPAVFDLFAGVDHILHAGDIGRMEIITELRTIAPVTAVYGNVDDFPVVGQFPERIVTTFAGTKALMTHIVGDRSPGGVRRFLRAVEEQEVSMIVYGHTHEARIEVVENVLLLNPGSAGPARWKTRASVATLNIDEGKPPSAEILWL